MHSFSTPPHTQGSGWPRPLLRTCISLSNDWHCPHCLPLLCRPAGEGGDRLSTLALFPVAPCVHDTALYHCVHCVLSLVLVIITRCYKCCMYNPTPLPPSSFPPSLSPPPSLPPPPSPLPSPLPFLFPPLPPPSLPLPSLLLTIILWVPWPPSPLPLPWTH